MSNEYLLWLFLLLLPLSVQAQESFAGPFPSWANVKTAYGAVGNGTTDDTAALQSAFSAVGSSFDVVYLPAGTYKITGTLSLAHKLRVAVVGENPATTKILWAGPGGGMMASFDGVNQCRFGRITWDGNHSAGVGVRHGWTNTSISPAGVDNVHFDEYFENAQKGVVGGVNPPGWNDSEVRFFRCHFIGNSIAGFSTESQNALDYWIWDSEFTNNARGVANNVGPGNGGNFYVYNSLFQHSTIGDITACTSNLPFSIKNNVSTGSNQFFNGCAGGQNARQLFIQGNRILDTANPVAIQIGDVGTTVLVDNQIRSAPGAVGPAVRMQAFSGADFTSVGNQFTVASAISVSGNTVRQWAVDDSTVLYSSISGSLPTLPATPTRITANIIEVSAGSNSAAIQAAINTAAGLAGSHPVVHLPKGNYSIGTTLTVPPSLDVLIVGDGRNTALNWSSGSAGSILDLQGPSKAQVADIAFNGAHVAEDITVNNSDQVNGLVTTLGGSVQGNTINDVLGDRLVNTDLNLIGLYIDRSSQTALKALGPGSSTNSRVGVFGVCCGTGGGNQFGLMYDVQNGGQMLVEDSWYESGYGPTAVNLTGSGTFTYQGGTIAQDNNGSISTPGVPVGVNGFTGNATFIGLQLFIPSTSSASQVTVTNENSNTKVLLLGFWDNQPVSNYFNRTGSGGTVTFINNKKFGSTGAFQISDQGNARTDAFIRTMLNQIRTESADLPIASGAGVTNVLLSRLGLFNGTIGLHLKSSGSVSPAPSIGSFTASPVLVAPTVSSVLSWTTADATALTIDHGVGVVTGTLTTTVSPLVTTVYTLTATGAGGTTIASVTVTVSSGVGGGGGAWGHVATDQELLTAADHSHTTLSAGVNSSVASFPVSGASTFIVNQVATVDSEQVQITSVSPTALGVTRGFAGTTAALHGSAAVLYGRIAPIYPNAFCDELIRFEDFVSTSAHPGTFPGTAAAGVSWPDHVMTRTECGTAIDGASLTVTGWNRASAELAALEADLFGLAGSTVSCPCVAGTGASWADHAVTTIELGSAVAGATPSAVLHTRRKAELQALESDIQSNP